MQDGTKIRAMRPRIVFAERSEWSRGSRSAEQVAAVEAMSEEKRVGGWPRGASERSASARSGWRRRLRSLRSWPKKASAKDKEKRRVSTTDPQARVMKQPDGGFAPSYNVQVNTDAKTG